MSANPFSADLGVRDRIAALRLASGAAIAVEIGAFVGHPGGPVDGNLGSVVPADTVARLIAEHGLRDAEELMLVALPAAEKMARPPISSFYVGCIGLEAKTGNLILGGNLEFPGTHLATTVHGEGFVFTRAFSRDRTVRTIAIGEAHPCAHCRQYLSEFAATADLTLIDPLGHRLRMADLYPWPFDPNYLGDPGVTVGHTPLPALQIAQNDLPADVALPLLHAGQRSHAPYSKCPAAVALTLRDGAVVTGSAIESVAFNPTMSPMQAALIDLLAHGYGYGDIASAAVGTVFGGAVDYSRSTAELLRAVAPDVGLAVVAWKL